MVANFGFKITFLNSFLCEKIDSFQKFLKHALCHKKKLTVCHINIGVSDCRQPRLGDQKEIVKIKIYVIFFLSAVRKPYWFSDWVQSNVRLSEDWSSLGFTFVVWDRLGEVLEKELPIYNQPRSAGHQLSAQKPPANAVKQKVCQGKDGDRRQVCPKQWALLQEFTFPFFYFICFKK